MYEYGLAINGRVFIHPSRESAEAAVEATREESSDPEVVKLVRRSVGEWERVL